MWKQVFERVADVLLACVIGASFAMIIVSQLSK